MTRLERILFASVLAGICVFNAHLAFANNVYSGVCAERPWTCAPEAHAIVTAMRHTSARQHSVAYSTLSARTCQKSCQTRAHNLEKSQGLDRFALVPELAKEVAKIISTCGSKLISGYRPGAVVAGTHRASLHSRYPSEAADMAGNPSCIYALLKNWPGGVSVDYGRVRHVHFSYEPRGREWGSRFFHGGGRRYAHSKHRKVAS